MLNPISLISKIFKSSNQKELNNLAKIVAKINLLEEKTAKLDDADFKNQTLKLREKYKKGTKEILPQEPDHETSKYAESARIFKKVRDIVAKSDTYVKMRKEWRASE